jgi:hypothetical protein
MARLWRFFPVALFLLRHFFFGAFFLSVALLFMVYRPVCTPPPYFGLKIFKRKGLGLDFGVLGSGRLVAMARAMPAPNMGRAYSPLGLLTPATWAFGPGCYMARLRRFYPVAILLLRHFLSLWRFCLWCVLLCVPLPPYFYPKIFKRKGLSLDLLVLAQAG